MKIPDLAYLYRSAIGSKDCIDKLKDLKDLARKGARKPDAATSSTLPCSSSCMKTYNKSPQNYSPKSILE
jgi:hypothetical protein